MNRAERRRIKVKRKTPVYTLTSDQIEQIKVKATNDAVVYLLAVPVMVIHDHFGKLMKKEGREERFANMILETLDCVLKDFVTIEDLKKLLYEETGMKFERFSP